MGLIVVTTRWCSYRLSQNQISAERMRYSLKQHKTRFFTPLQCGKCQFAYFLSLYNVTDVLQPCFCTMAQSESPKIHMHLHILYISKIVDVWRNRPTDCIKIESPANQQSWRINTLGIQTPTHIKIFSTICVSTWDGQTLLTLPPMFAQNQVLAGYRQ